MARMPSVQPKAINVGLIGYGYWGPNQARIFSDINGVCLHTLCDHSYERLKAAKTKYPGLNVCADPDELMKDPEVDAVVIAAPVSTHASLTRQALLSGKHVYVEKPLSMSYRDALGLAQLSRKAKRTLMVGHTFLYSPPVRKIKQLIDRGTLGKIYYLNSSRVNLGLFQPDASVFWDLAPHDIAIFLYWLECDPLWVCAQGASFVRRNILEVGFATLGFPRGIIAHLHVSWLAPSKIRLTTVVGSQRMIIYDDASSNEKVKIYDQGVVRNPETFGEFQLTYRSGDVLSPHLEASEPLRNQALDFIRAIRSNRSPASDGLFGSRVVRVLEAIQTSVQRKGNICWIR